MKKQHYLWADVIRVSAIFFVLIAHALGTSYPANPNHLHIFFASLYATPARISVPLLIMLSGALLLGKREPISLFFKKRVLRIVVPWIVWTMIYFLFNIWWFQIQYTSGMQGIHDLYVIFMSNFWFLPMLTGLYLVTPVLRMWLQQAKPLHLWIVILLWFLIFSVIPLMQTIIYRTNNTHWYIPEHFGYFLLGHMVVQGFFSRMSKSLVLLFFILSITALTLGVFSPYIGLLPPLNYFEYNVSVLAIIATLSTFLFFYSYFSTPQFSHQLREIIAKIATISLGIMFSEDIISRFLKSGVLFGLQLQHLPLFYPIAVPVYAGIVFILTYALLKIVQLLRVGKFFY